MGRLVHFEIYADDMDRAKKFYGEVFGWTFEDWSEYAGMPYFGAVTGDEDEPGINGALMQRQSPPPESDQPVNGYACTMGVEDYDAVEAKILDNGGVTAMPKYALPGKNHFVEVLSKMKLLLLKSIKQIAFSHTNN